MERKTSLSVLPRHYSTSAIPETNNFSKRESTRKSLPIISSMHNLNVNSASTQTLRFPQSDRGNDFLMNFRSKKSVLTRILNQRDRLMKVELDRQALAQKYEKIKKKQEIRSQRSREIIDYEKNFKRKIAATVSTSSLNLDFSAKKIPSQRQKATLRVSEIDPKTVPEFYQKSVTYQDLYAILNYHKEIPFKFYLFVLNDGKHNKCHRILV